MRKMVTTFMVTVTHTKANSPKYLRQDLQELWKWETGVKVKVKRLQLPKVTAYKCNHCQDTGRISWTDYSNGQGLDIDREDDCDKCDAALKRSK